MASGIFTINQVNQAIRQGAWSGYIAPTWVEYLVVAGGGGGGGGAGYAGGGGGAGGLLTGIVSITGGTSYTVTVGAGGSAVTTVDGTSGSNSVFGQISSTGGGYGCYGQSRVAGTGGSGGGTGANNTSVSPAGAQGVAGQGNSGGAGYPTTTASAGGGGGAGTKGLDSVIASVGGNGGSGIASAISGTVTTYAGGGGGAANNGNTGGIGGVGGGGNGASGTSTNATAGSSNAGGGGGGAGNQSGGTSVAGAGGSGIVIVRYPGSVQFFTGGTLSYGNGYVIHTFYSSGTLAPTTPTPYIDSTYQITRSLRFNSADSASLTRTPASASNRKTWTWSSWVKRSAISSGQLLFNATNGSDVAYLYFNPGDALVFGGSLASGSFNTFTTAVYRDPSAWYHIVCVFDTTQAVATDRTQLYVNGQRLTLNNTPGFAQNSDGPVNSTVLHYLGAWSYGGSFLNGYMTEINFIDGQALTPSSFGYTNPSTGVWSPVKFVGTYGTNGFYLNFSDNSNTTAATLGKDYSGNGNNWTPNNFSVSAGAGNDSLVDSPTSYGTDTGVGGTVRGNYCTWNPLGSSNSSLVFSNGNLDFSGSSGFWGTRGSIGMSSGKWYWEVTAGGSAIVVGIMNSGVGNSGGDFYPGVTANGWGYYGGNGNKFNNNASSAYGATFTTNDVIGIAFDADTGTLTFYKNGTSQGTAYSSLVADTYFPAFGESATTGSTNFGQRPFAYTAPSGYKALCTQNLPTPTIGATSTTLANKYFAPTIYTQVSGANTITTGLDMSTYGGLIWEKPRSIVESNYLTDTVRGLTKYLVSNTTAAEGTTSTYIQSVTSTGYTTAANAWATGTSMVSWDWIAGGAGSSNTAGSITSTVSANTTSGFSVVTFTGTGANATIGHGLGVAPKMVIVKSRTVVQSWIVYHASLGNTSAVLLNLANASDTNSVYWNNTSPTSSVFSLGTNTATNQNGSSNVAYCFAEVDGYSKFGSWTGNGSSDGPFVFTGFRPAYILWKRTDSGTGGDWGIVDATRNPSNVVGEYLAADLSSAGATYSMLDMVSNGFKIRWSDVSTNASGGTYIFMALASNPFKYALAR